MLNVSYIPTSFKSFYDDPPQHFQLRLNLKRSLDSMFFMERCWDKLNPLTPVTISKLLELIGRSAYILACSPATAPDSDINQSAGSRGHLSTYVNKSMHACQGVSVACRPAEKRRPRGEIGSVHRSILVGHRWPNGRQRVITVISNAMHLPNKVTSGASTIICYTKYSPPAQHAG
jgi:hypothetical protein